MQDIVAESPTIYKNRQRAARNWPASLWAEEWVGFIWWFKGLRLLGVPAYNIFFKFTGLNETDQTPEAVNSALSPIYNSIVTYSMLPRNAAERQLLKAADKLHELGFDCWISFRKGLRTGDPDGRSKLFLTIAKMGSLGRTVHLNGYLRYNAIVDYDLLPKGLPYIR